MPEIARVDSAQLKQWADRVSARNDLPRLVRRLILETGRGVVQLGFPAGEGVSAGDWDGSVRATEATPFVPDGLSVWELSVNKSPGRKAEEDYSKRTSTPDGSPTTNATYVAVSLRPWTKRAEWAREKQKDKRWRAVRPINLDEIETWLETAPVTHAWLADQLGLEPYGLRAAESWWKIWSHSTSPPISPALVLAGRESIRDSIQAVLSGSPAITTISGPSIEEVLAFLAAHAIDFEEEDGGQLLARLAFVDSVASWRALQGAEQPLILVPVTEEIRKELGGQLRHHVLVPLTGASMADFELPPIDPDGARKALEGAGAGEVIQLNELSRLARRSLLALRRRLAVKPALHSPPWAAPPGTRVVRAGLLAGRWNSAAEGDERIIEDLAGQKGDDLREALDTLVAEEDPLLGRLERSWALTSPFDAWLQLRSQLQRPDLERLEKAAMAVLLEADPALSLPPEERWRAGFEGQGNRYSGRLKHGLAESIVLLAVNGERIADGSGAGFAAYLVRKLLESANEDATGIVWASLAPQLPLLAEAAPDSFLEAVRDGLSGEEPVLAKLFDDPSDQDPMFTAGSAHCHLLWALETVVWSPAHFGLAVDLLARAAEIDPGGRLTNRPARSLVEVFCPWHPENAADNAGRLAVVDGLRQHHPRIAWDLMLSMLPESHGIRHPTREPRYRDWKPPHPGVTNLEYFEFVNAIAERLVADAGRSGPRWVALLNRGSDLLADGRRAIREGLAERIDEIQQDERAELWEAIRSFVATHHEYAEADWALPAGELQELKDLQSRLAPSGAIHQQRWLFEEHSPDLGRRKFDDLAGFEADLEQRRAAAALEIEAEVGVEALLEMGAETEYPGTVGWALALGTEGKHDSLMLSRLGADSRAEATIASAFFAKRFLQAGWAWLEDLLPSEAATMPVARGRLLLASREYPKAWELAESLGEDTERALWADFSPYGLGAFDRVAIAARKLLDFGRPASSLCLLELYIRKGSADSDELALLVADGLDALLEVTSASRLDALEGLSQHSFEEFFGFLEAHRGPVGADRVARLEWAFLGALGYDPNVPMLHEELAANPEFFVQVISALYKEASADSAGEPSEEERRVAENGFRLLSSWSIVPGTIGEGDLDEERLQAWIAEARRLLKAADRLMAGETQIGRVLASGGWDTQDRWPSEPVRNLLEELQSKRVEEGLRIETYNSRGVASRSLDAGGEQEMEIAEKYEKWATEFQDRWPRTASVLRDLGKSYRADAKRHDAEAEERRRGFDL